MLGHVQLAQMTGEKEDLEKCIEVLHSGLKRAGELMTGFKAGLTDTEKKSLFNAKNELLGTLKKWGPALDRDDIQWSVRGQECYIVADPDRFQKAVCACVMNLAAFLPQGSALDLELGRGDGELLLTIAGIRRDGKPGKEPGVETTSDVVLLRQEERNFLEAAAMEMNGRFEETLLPGGIRALRIVLPAE